MAHPDAPDAAIVRRDMQVWLERAVIGLNLCPFAKAVHVKGQVHLAISAATQEGELLDALERELSDLIDMDPHVRDTTLLVAPCVLPDFLDFNGFLARAERVIARRRLKGIIQLAAFHPGWEFAGAGPDDIANFTNRAPYPTLHLLREGSIDRAVAAFPDAEAIYGRNIETLERLGPGGWAALGVGKTAA